MAAVVQRSKREESGTSKQCWTGRASRHLHQCQQARMLRLEAGGHNGGLHALRPRNGRGIGHWLADTFLQLRTVPHFP